MGTSKAKVKWINKLKDYISSICVADYAEELRFYLIHMTEVRDVCVCVRVRACVCVLACGVQEKGREKQKGKEGLM